MNKLLILGSVALGICAVSFVLVGLVTDKQLNRVPSTSAPAAASPSPVPSNPPEAPASSGPQSPESLMSDAEFFLREGRFSQAAGCLNRIVSEHPTSRQRMTVDKICSFLRDKESNKDGPVTSDEARRFRSFMDSVVKIKQGYRTTTPEKRKALEDIFGAETFRRNDNGLDAVAAAGKNLEASRDTPLQGQ